MPPSMTPEAFRAWKTRLGLSLSAAGRAIGRSRPAIVRYLKGDLPIDRTVALACWAVEEGAPREVEPYTATGKMRKP